MATITATLHHGLTVEIAAGHHRWSADEPIEAGGSDEGPTTYELLLGALAACTCITVALYCRRKGWSLEAIHAEFSHDRIHADDCADCEQEHRGLIDRIRSRITITGDFDDEQRRRLAQIAVRCPVHKTLAQGVVFDDTVTIDAGGAR